MWRGARFSGVEFAQRRTSGGHVLNSFSFFLFFFFSFFFFSSSEEMVWNVKYVITAVNLHVYLISCRPPHFA